MSLAIVGPHPLSGRCQVPSDKAISHRAALLAACSPGASRIANFAQARDCRASILLVRSLGCGVVEQGDKLTVTGLGLTVPRRVLKQALDCGRSGTTMRLGAGLVAGLPFTLRLTGHPQLLRRPMERVAEPLRLMGAEVTTASGGCPPLEIRGGHLAGIEFTPPQASAQVKSAVLLAALRASSATTICEPVPTRDHTERLLLAMGARLRITESGAGTSVELEPGPLGPLQLRVPGDTSSAAVIATAAALVPGSEVVLERVAVNPSRLGFFNVLRRMGGRVDLEPRREDGGPEPVADIRVRYAKLEAFRVEAGEVPSLIDELPLLGLLATAAEGVSEVQGAAELRVKESDRIAGLIAGLRTLGAEAEELEDGFRVRGPVALRGGACDARTDHRLAMTFTLAELISQGPVEVSGAEFVADSFPGFLNLLRVLS
ncbi:MAG TPA: 3-phosphoshikimate 1-carboxyvinyltransferase [Candidatus Dormibacteraeota bacterium]|nr:3-phosphoshikimate 1-carboxyvinyltransferase [Candidatus Dormibacteraeota bacterium]